MNLLVFGMPGEFPGLPEITHAYLWLGEMNVNEAINDEALDTFLEMAASAGVPVSIFTENMASLSDEVLDQVASVEEVSKIKQQLSISPLLTTDAIACMTWTGSDADYRLLEFLQSHDMVVLDMADGFAELQIGESPDIDELVKVITDRVTAEVLKTVRAEMKEMLSSRRWRSGSPRA
jgi:hypothetical protein